MIRAEPLTLAALDLIDPIYEGGDLVARTLHARGANPEFAEVISDENGPFMAWGVQEMWPGVGEIWIYLGTRAKTRLVSVFKLAITKLEWLEHEKGFRRLEARFNKEIPTHSLAAHLGFEVEGMMANYGLGGEGDFILMARTTK